LSKRNQDFITEELQFPFNKAMSPRLSRGLDEACATEICTLLDTSTSCEYSHPSLRLTLDDLFVDDVFLDGAFVFEGATPVHYPLLKEVP
jgi:hypothetical protein